MKETNSDAWFIVNSKPKQEFIAERNLRTLGVKVYLPLYFKKVKKNKEKVNVVSPLFSGYLFAQFPISEFYHKVRYTRGVKMVLGSNECLWTIDGRRIESIKSRESDGIVQLSRKEERFQRGDLIKIDEGEFDGWEGIFYEELPDRERAIILLTNVKFSSKLIIPKKYLIPQNR
jgi:transcriptional antiterminator RfaH